MLQINRVRLCLLVVLFTIHAICDSKAISRDISKITPVLNIVEPINTTTVVDAAKPHMECEQLPQLVLAELLGEAYNGRYMSINWPTTGDDNIFSSNANFDRTSYTHNKRRANDDHNTFYVDDKFTSELDNRPAWDVNRAFAVESKTKYRRRRSAAAIAAVLTPDTERMANFEAIHGHSKRTQETTELTAAEATAVVPEQQQIKEEQRKRQHMVGISNDDNDNISSRDGHSNKIYDHEDGMHTDNANETFPARSKRAYGRDSGGRKTYPWKCDSSIRWIDLGPDYFPRFLRTVECTKHYCWYKAFVCKAKSFAIKILRRREGMCADAENLRKLTSFDFRGDFGEVWKWEEVAINVCCDCAVA